MQKTQNCVLEVKSVWSLIIGIIYDVPKTKTMTIPDKISLLTGMVKFFLSLMGVKRSEDNNSPAHVSV